MSWKTSKGFITSEERIRRIEEIESVAGILTSGAEVQYAKRKKGNSLGILADGGFAEDIVMIRDDKNKTMIIPGLKQG